MTARSECEIIFSNRPESILRYTDQVLSCDIHTRARTKRILKKAGASVVFGMDEILSSLFILDMETKFLCREDCKGLCPTCGKNLNLGPCGCRKSLDPRFAVLEQLLDK